MSTGYEPPTLFDAAAQSATTAVADRSADAPQRSDHAEGASGQRRGHLTLVFSADSVAEDVDELHGPDDDGHGPAGAVARGRAGIARMLGLDAPVSPRPVGSAAHPAGLGREFSGSWSPSHPDGPPMAEVTAGREARHVAVLPPAARSLRRRVLAAGLASGCPVDANALSAILAAKVVNHPAPINQFTEDMVWQLVWIDVFSWCSIRGVVVSDVVSETLWTLINFLAEANELHPDSSPVADLLGPLQSCGGLGADGMSRTPTDRRNA